MDRATRSICGEYGEHGICSFSLGCSVSDAGKLNAGAGSEGSLKDVDLRVAIKYSAGRMRHDGFLSPKQVGDDFRLSKLQTTFA